MIKLIIFDLSNVCYNIEEPPYIKMFAKEHGLNQQELDDFYQSWLVKAEVAEMTGREVWEKVFEKFDLKEDVNQIISGMMDLKKEFKENLEFVKKLRTKYKTAYLTNYNQDYWDVIKERFDLSPYFDFGLVSYQVKARKPAVEGFQAILKYFGVSVEETIFTDDQEKNLVNAKELGIKVIQFTNLKEFKEKLQEFGVDVK